MLGPFEVRTDEGVVADVPGARLRSLLVALALEPGRVIPRATLVAWIWGEDPPSDAAVTRLEGLRLSATEDRFDAEVSVRAEQGEDRARTNIEVDAVENDLVPECLPQPRGCYR
jgi:hypothetical protein